MGLKAAVLILSLLFSSLVVKAQPYAYDSTNTPLTIHFQSTTADTAIALNGLRSELASILPNTAYKKMTPACKVVFYEPDNSLHPIYAVNPDLPVMPASVEKLFTTSTVLWALGSDYTFKTRLDLLPAARVEGRSVIGNIYLRPSGDPTLSMSDFDEIAKKLKEVGIDQIEGDIVSDLSDDDILTPDAKRYFAQHTEEMVTSQGGGDSTAGDNTTEINDDEEKPSVENSDNDEEENEGAIPGYISASPNFFIDRNIVTLRVTAGSKKGEPVHITLTPPLATVKIVNHATTGAASSISYKKVKVGKGRRAKVKNVAIKSRSPYTLHLTATTTKEGAQFLTLTGVIPARRSKQYTVPIKDVPMTMAALLKWRLEQNGIRISGTARSGRPPKGVNEYRTLIEKETPLLDLLRVTNKRSDNFLAESMFRKLSSIADVAATNPAERSRKLIRSWMDVLSVNCQNGYCADGSGLSHDNHTTATTVIDLLHGIRTREKMYPDFVSTLSVAGVDGTTRGRMINSAAFNNAHSKTGTLNAVTALAGYVSTRDGQLASYFITMQNMHGGVKGYKYIQDQIVQKLAGFSYADYIAKYAPAPAITPPPAFTAPAPRDSTSSPSSSNK